MFIIEERRHSHAQGSLENVTSSQLSLNKYKNKYSVMYISDSLQAAKSSSGTL